VGGGAESGTGGGSRGRFHGYLGLPIPIVTLRRTQHGWGWGTLLSVAGPHGPPVAPPVILYLSPYYRPSACFGCRLSNEIGAMLKVSFGLRVVDWQRNDELPAP
jgi:hypothetical protein